MLPICFWLHDCSALASHFNLTEILSRGSRVALAGPKIAALPHENLKVVAKNSQSEIYFFPGFLHGDQGPKGSDQTSLWPGFATSFQDINLPNHWCIALGLV